ncbi:CsbD family protein [Nocardia wallacei]|uniref:CsbD family protein n=1 Tax=Nocardia wallacei TaxID=480035 RepID=UPI002456883A|nr:CsbD family protein [Nocardia wallacei]
MSANDKFAHTVDDLRGTAKQAAGQVTGDDQLRDEGRTDQAEAGVKQAADDVKAALGEVVDKLRDRFGK